MAAPMGDDLEKKFEKASVSFTIIADTLEPDQLLYFYARFKQARDGPCHQPKPGLFDFQGKQKWDAWKKLGSKSRDDAMKEYIDKLSEVDPDWEMKSSNGNKSGFGISVSTMYHEDAEISPENKTVFDWCVEGDEKNVEKFLNCDSFDINQKDNEGLGLIHWACDRGCVNMVKLLLKYKADINLKDSEGQTGLHYGCSCEHSEIVKLLLSEGADISLKDDDGLTATETTDNEHIKSLIQR